MTVELATRKLRPDRGYMTLTLGLLGTALVDVVLYPVALALREQGHDFQLLYAAAHALRDGYNPYDQGGVKVFCEVAAEKAIGYLPSSE